MKERILSEKEIEAFDLHLKNQEKSTNTRIKYIRDVKAFVNYTNGRKITKEIVIEYKRELIGKNYATRSINSILSSLNSMFTFLGWSDLKIKAIKVQRQIYRHEEKELTKAEYVKLINTAVNEGKERLALIIQTICATGIRVGELEFITAQSIQIGEAIVSLKGKTRSVFIVSDLQKKLLRYIAEHKIKSGPVFITRSGTPVSRNNIWSEMKKLCERAQVNPQKVYPHNLRHLFARTFYDIENDVVKLADILGHSNINTTRIYTISTGDQHRKCMENMHLTL